MAAESRAEQRISEAEAAAVSSKQAAALAKDLARDSDRKRQSAEQKLVRNGCRGGSL